MGNEKVLSDEILRDAQRKAERARTRAEREAKKLRDKAARAAEADAGKTLDAARERAERQARAILATVEAEAKLDLLAARERELEKLFDAARHRLADKASYDYPAVLAALAVQAIQAMDADEVVLGLSDGDRAIATEAWLADVRTRVGRDVTIEVANDAPTIDGGLIVRSADGRLLYDNSFATRLERLRPELRRQLAEVVYAAGTGDHE